MKDKLWSCLVLCGFVLAIIGAFGQTKECRNVKVEKAMKHTEIIDSSIKHRNDTIKLLDSVVELRKAKVQHKSKPEVKHDIDSLFAGGTCEDDKETLQITVGQAKQILQLQVQHDGDSAKLAVDNRTLETVQGQTDSLKQEIPKIEPTTDWHTLSLGLVVGGLITAIIIAIAQ